VRFKVLMAALWKLLPSGMWCYEYIFWYILWHDTWKPEQWSQKIRPLLGNGPLKSILRSTKIQWWFPWIQGTLGITRHFPLQQIARTCHKWLLGIIHGLLWQRIHRLKVMNCKTWWSIPSSRKTSSDYEFKAWEFGIEFERLQTLQDSSCYRASKRVSYELCVRQTVAVEKLSVEEKSKGSW
jgi:hypothetical protein